MNKFGIRVSLPDGVTHHDFVTEVATDLPPNGSYKEAAFGNLRLRIGRTPGGVRILMTNTGRPPYVAGGWTGGEPFRFNGVALGVPGDRWEPHWGEQRQTRPAGFQFEGMTIWEGVGPTTTRCNVGPNRRPPEPAGVFVLEGGQSLTWEFTDGNWDVRPIVERLRQFEGDPKGLPTNLRGFLSVSAADKPNPGIGARGALWYMDQYDKRFGYGRLPPLRGPFLWGCLPWAEGLTSHYGLDYELLLAGARHHDDPTVGLLVTEAKITQGFALCRYSEGTFSNSTHAMESYEKSGGASATEWPNRATNSFPQWTHNWYRGLFAANYALNGQDFLFAEASRLAALRLLSVDPGRVWRGNYGMRGLLWGLESWRAAVQFKAVLPGAARTYLSRAWFGVWKPVLLAGFTKEGFYPTLDAPTTINPWMDLMVRYEIDLLRKFIGDNDEAFTALLDAAYDKTMAVGSRVRADGLLEIAMVAGRTDPARTLWREAVLAVDCLPVLKGKHLEQARLLFDRPMQVWSTINTPYTAHRYDWGADTYSGSIPKAAAAWLRASWALMRGTYQESYE